MVHKNLNKKLHAYLTHVNTTIEATQTVQEALSSLRKRHIHDEIIYFYVLDEKKKLVGVVSTRKLLLEDPDSLIADIMDTSLVTLKGDQTLQDAMEFLEAHRLLAIPVIDDNHIFLGTIDVCHYLEEKPLIANDRRHFDIFQMIGFYVQEGKKASTWSRYLSRMPWIFCNLFGGIFCAVISNIFEEVLAKMLLLAMFIPLVLTLSESISMQSMSQSLHLLQGKSFHKKQRKSFLWREGKIIVMLAISCGVMVGCISIFWGEGVLPAVTIGCGIICSIFLSASLGTFIPLILRSRRWDPRVASGPVVLMLADMGTTFVYLLLGSWWLV